MKNQKTIAATGIYQLLLRGGSPEVTRSWNGQSFDIEVQSDRDNGNLESVKGSELETELAKAVAFLNDMYDNHGWAITIDDVCIEEVTDHHFFNIQKPNKMKAIETIIYMKQELTVLVTADDRDRATVDYFLNGVQVTEWKAMKRDFQELFTTLADVVCKNLSLTKW